MNKSKEKYKRLIKTAIKSLPRDSDKCQITCKPIFVLAKEMIQEICGIYYSDDEFTCKEDETQLVNVIGKVIKRSIERNWFHVFLGRSRITVASALVYVIHRLLSANMKVITRITQEMLSGVVGVSIPAIRKAYVLIVPHLIEDTSFLSSENISISREREGV